MLNGFKQFILRGNVVNLAVGVVIGAAFGGIVSSLVADVLTPLIGAIAKMPDFSGWYFSLNGSKFMLGKFINALISFLLISGSVYFFIVSPMNSLLARMKKAPPADHTSKKCPECISEIPLQAKKCAFCASQLI